MSIKSVVFSILSIIFFSTLNAQDRNKPLTVADEFDLNISPTKTYFKHKKEGVIFSKVFSNKGSAYIRLHVNSFDLKPGDYLKVYSKSGEEFIYSEKGKIIGNQGEMISEFWTNTIWNDTVIVELHTKGENNSHYGFNIDRVAYGYSQERINAAIAQLDNNSSQKTVCSNDDKEAIVCYDGTEMGRKSKAVCRLLINGGNLCTGWLLGCDGSLMTNNHCIDTASDANNTDYLFNFQYSNCAGTTNASRDLQADNATFIQTNANLDFTLVKLPVNPTPTYGFLSLSSIPVTTNERIYIPQHPGGRRKEIAVNSDVDPDPNGFAKISNAGTGNPGSRVSYQADTEGGSSGSPVLRFNDHLVVAIHNTGGCANGSRGRSDQLINAIGSNMPNCGIDDNSPSTPTINTLSTLTVTVNEGTDCSFTDINLPIKISAGASQNANVTFNVTNSTATNLIDYQILTPTVTFLANDNSVKNAILRVYNDSFVEANETLNVNLLLDANGGNASLGLNKSFNIVIKDDDFTPSLGKTTQLFANNFENGIGDFTVTGGPDQNFAIGTTAVASSTFLDMSANTSNFAYVNDDSCNCDLNNERLAITSSFDFSTINQANVTFDYVYGDENGGIYNNIAFVQVSTDNGVTWANVGTEFEISTWTTKTVDLSAFSGQPNVKIAFYYSDQTNFSYGLGIDNIVVSAIGNADVQEAINTSSTANIGLKSSGTAHIYDSNSGNVVTTITNNNNQDYGCLNASVTRSGNGAQPFNDSSGAELAMDKSFYITTTNTISNGDNTVTFYFTEVEITGWETAVANAGGNYNRNDLHILRDENIGVQSFAQSTETSIATLGNFGNNITLTGTFTNIKGAYLFAPQSTLLSVDNFNTTNFDIFPNPVNNELTIQTTNGKLPNTINVYNMLGQIILKKPIHTITDLKVNTSALSNGMYFLSIQSDTTNQTIKFLKK